MPILHVPKSHHLQSLTVLRCSSVGMVFQSAYDMHLRPYVDHRTMTGTTPVSVGPITQ
jgi:hypothetical protein